MGHIVRTQKLLTRASGKAENVDISEKSNVEKKFGLGVEFKAKYVFDWENRCL